MAASYDSRASPNNPLPSASCPLPPALCLLPSALPPSLSLNFLLPKDVPIEEIWLIVNGLAIVFQEK